MYRVTLKDTFSAAHSLWDDGGKFEDLHGHDFKVEVEMERKELDEIGVVIDFLDVKRKLKMILARIDHVFLNELPEFKGKNTSVENVARFIHDELSKQVKKQGVMVKRVTVWETEDAGATYIP